MLGTCISSLDSDQCKSFRSKLGFYVPFNSQGHIGTGPQVNLLGHYSEPYVDQL